MEIKGRVPAQICPSCGDRLQIERLRCPCGVAVEGLMRWPRLARLPLQDQQLIELLVLCGGSLKEVSARMTISYPTLRKRLDEIIGRLEQEIKGDTTPKPENPS